MDLKKYIYGHCVSPVRTKVFDSYSCSTVVKLLPCGECLHCKNTHVNEWVTRLYAQANYSKHVYYITLDYAPFDLSSPVGKLLAQETAACYHNINSTGTYGMHPLVLCKNHLQDYFKRLRKNTGYKFQYFACGEYGTHAKGKGYGRPHFHAIIFCDNKIDDSQFNDAWSIYGYKVGRVDINDLRANGSLDEIKSQSTSNYNAKYVFKYVCKYLQKGDFQFENLSTIDFHRAFFKALNMVATQSDLFSGTQFTFPPDELLVKEWKEYIRKYSPFVVCSKRPSIGLAYFKDNAQRFIAQDYRLFGLSKECVAFPRYYVRKAREQMFGFSAIGSESGKVSSSARVGYILSVLRKIYDDRISVENFGNSPAYQWNKSKNVIESLYYGSHYCSIPLVDLHLYDRFTDVMYQFNGYGYNLWKKYNKIGFVKVGYMDIIDVIHKIQPLYNKYFDAYIRPMHDNKLLKDADLIDCIKSFYNDAPDAYTRFLDEVDARYKVELAQIRKSKLLQQNSKISF